MTQIFGVPSTILVPQTDGQFIARNHFFVDTGLDALARISHLSNAFRKRFLDGVGKIEDWHEAAVLSYASLLTPSIDGAVFTELGGKADTETSLWGAFHLMSKQPHGEEDTLLIAKETMVGSGNLFYIRDQFGELACVQITWQPSGWHVSCWDITTERSKWNEWEFGNQVFFPRPQLAHNVVQLERGQVARFG